MFSSCIVVADPSFFFDSVTFKFFFKGVKSMVNYIDEKLDEYHEKFGRV